MASLQKSKIVDNGAGKVKALKNCVVFYFPHWQLVTDPIKEQI